VVRVRQIHAPDVRVMIAKICDRIGIAIDELFDVHVKLERR
jgi:selenocysteine-specific translation elongation factor